MATVLESATAAASAIVVIFMGCLLCVSTHPAHIGDPQIDFFPERTTALPSASGRPRLAQTHKTLRWFSEGGLPVSVSSLSAGEHKGARSLSRSRHSWNAFQYASRGL